MPIGFAPKPSQVQFLLDFCESFLPCAALLRCFLGVLQNASNVLIGWPPSWLPIGDPGLREASLSGEAGETSGRRQGVFGGIKRDGCVPFWEDLGGC